MPLKKFITTLSKGRAVSKFVPAEDVVMPYVSTTWNLVNVLHMLLKQWVMKLRKKQVSGMYRDIDVTMSQVDKNKNDAQTKSMMNLDGITLRKTQRT